MDRCHDRRGPAERVRRTIYRHLALGTLAFLLVACSPAWPIAQPHPTPEPPLSPAPTPPWTTAPAASLPPTWTPLPTDTSPPLPTVTPSWPTPGPTRTPAPALNPGMQVATFFFFWHHCPDFNCEAATIYAVPPGWTEPLAGDPNSRDGLYYSPYNTYWYLQELRDMRLAGIDIVLPVSWGDNPQPWFRTAMLAGLVEANRQMAEPLRIGLMDDTTSEAAEYRDFADNGVIDGSTYLGGEPFMDLRDPVCGYFFYDRKIKPFFELIPQEMWATHNGRPVEEGGRPLIVAYVGNWFRSLDRAGALWTSIKNSFARDFHDRNGQPIVPWVVLEETWFTAEAIEGRPSLNEVADGRFIWGAALLGPKARLWRGYTVASVGPGFDDRKNRNSSNRVRPRDVTPDGQTGDPGAFLRAGLAQIPAQTNLLLIETWNELFEGTNVCRARYPEIAGQYVPEDYYLDVLRQALRGQALWRDAQPLAPSWPAQLAPGLSYRLSLAVQNSGTRTWSGVAGDRLVLGGDLFPGGLEVTVAAPVRPGEVGNFTVDIATPPEAGSHLLTWQMVGPEGPFGPVAAWTLQVGALARAPALEVDIPSAPVSVGRPVTLTLLLAPPTPITEVHLQVRLDPAIWQVEDVGFPQDVALRSWDVAVDNGRGMVSLAMAPLSRQPVRRVAQLRLRAVGAAEGGLWVERIELGTAAGIVVLPAQWVPLTVQPAP